MGMLVWPDSSERAYRQVVTACPRLAAQILGIGNCANFFGKGIKRAQDAFLVIFRAGLQLHQDGRVDVKRNFKRLQIAPELDPIFSRVEVSTRIGEAQFHRMFQVGRAHSDYSLNLVRGELDDHDWFALEDPVRVVFVRAYAEGFNKGVEEASYQSHTKHVWRISFAQFSATFLP